ncbi:MAG: DNA repair protein RadC [Chitinophagaceae bacterium]|nr:DNA repair protein RadC [Chitinophagaceae bacterium]
MKSVHKSSTSIKSWALDDRPREKLRAKGRSALSDSELLAILINTGSGKKSALDLAKEVLASCGNNLEELGKKEVEDLMQIKGIGEAKAVTIVAAAELCARKLTVPLRLKKQIKNSREVSGFLKGIFKDMHREVFVVIYLNRSNKILHHEIHTTGGITHTVVDPKLIFHKALSLRATQLILSHNHPSGSLQPSREDELMTRKIIEGGKLLDIAVLDHIIISDEGYYSFADEGKM